MSSEKSALSALTADEKATVLAELLAARPDLRELAESHATRLVSTVDRAAVADAVVDALRGLAIEELNGRAGYRPGRGYVEASEAAHEILDEAAEPFMRDLERRATLGVPEAATELAVGILLGLYECRDEDSETLFEYALDYAVDRATDVVHRCTKLGIELSGAELLDLLPDWDGLTQDVGMT